MTSDNQHITPPEGPRLADEASFLEDVAALADGSLPEERRAEVLARLADDPDMLDVLAEVTAIQEALEASSGESPAVEAAIAPATDAKDQAVEGSEFRPPAKILRGPWRRRAWTAVAALAAVLALVVVTPRLLSPGPPTPELMLSSLDLQALDGEQLQAPYWSPPRGLGDGEMFLEALGPRDSIRLGLIETMLVIALQKGDVALRHSLLPQLNQIRSSALTGYYRGLIQTEEPEVELALHLEDPAQVEQLVDPFYYRYGMWIRAAELAAASGQVEFFRGPGGRTLAALTPPDHLEQELRDLRRRVDRVEADGLEQLADHLAQLRRAHAG